MLLDTNVVSELISNPCERIVEEWADGLPSESMYFSSVCEAELRYGAAILPRGRRRSTLIANIERMIRETFRDRILPFDSKAACEYADIAAKHRSSGRLPKPIDCQIAAIARSQNMAVATRNVRDFKDIGVEVVDPWKQQPERHQ